MALIAMVPGLSRSYTGDRGARRGSPLAPATAPGSRTAKSVTCFQGCLCDNKKVQSTFLATLNGDREPVVINFATQPGHIEIFDSRDPQLYPLYFSPPAIRTMAAIVTALFQVLG